MADLVQYDVRDGIAVLSVANPPVNALSRAVRAALMDALDRAEEDDAVVAIVLAGRGATFPAGAELGEYETGLREPSLRDLCERVEYCEKPVVAALSGTAFGGGLELALAAHYRIAATGTRLSMPEVRLGLPPAGGGSQRLPRLVGAQMALDMMLRAQILVADQQPGQALVDGVTDGDPLAAACRFARQVAGEGKEPRRLSASRRGFEDMAAYMQAVEAARKTLPPDPEAAPVRILALVEAAPLLPFEAALSMEQDAFETCLASDTSRALRHAFVAERAARRFRTEGLPELPKIDRVAVLGSGPLAVQLVLAALNSGLGVNWGTRDAGRLEEGVAQLRALIEHGTGAGGGDPEGRLARLRTGDSAAMTPEADLILHAARGQGDVPAPPDAVRMVAMPARVDEIGLRFPPPVFQTRLMEVIEGPGCTPRQTAFALALADRLGKVPVQVKSMGDSIAGRLSSVLHRAADALVDKGADPYAVDAAVSRWGWSMSPFRTRDLGGLTEYAQARRAEGARNWSDVLLEAGRSGRAGGAGFYDWRDAGPIRSGAATALIDAARPASPFEKDAIMPLLVGALAAEGARMLETGMAQKASDIDAVALLALGFPRWHGGPMKYASLSGLFTLQTRMARLGHPDSEVWEVGPLWRDLVKNGRSFDAA